jgi:hypothetical protein
MDTTNELSQSAESFFVAGGDIESIDLTPEMPSKHVLEQLGSPPFAKMTFPMMGFLATVYEHVAGQVK